MPTSDESAEPTQTHEWSPVRWAFKAWLWIVLLAAALIAELVAGPLLAALVLALKFGGSDLALGIWLRHRGAPALGYVAWAQAFLKIALAGCVLAIVFSSLEPLFGLPFDPWRFAGAFMMLMGGGLLTTVCIGAGAQATLDDPYRLWLDKSAYGDLLANRWPLSCSGKRNRVPLLLILGIIATMFFATAMTAVLAGQAWQGRSELWFGAGLFATLGLLGLWKDAVALWDVYVQERAQQAEPPPLSRG